MDIRLDDKNALVCGASKGIGRATAMELARLGANVTLLSRSKDKLEKLVADLPTTNHQAHAYIAVDMSDSAGVQEKMAELAEQRTIHILINNSGGPQGGPITEAHPEAFLNAYTQHLIAGHIMFQALLPGMRQSGYGRLVNIISTSIKTPLAGLGVSNTTRAAVAAWAKTLSSEVAKDGITVNNILPGSTATDRIEDIIQHQMDKTGKSHTEILSQMYAAIPAGRFGKPEETAQAAAFLCTPAAAYINGVSLAVDGGRTPSLT